MKTVTLPRAQETPTTPTVHFDRAARQLSVSLAGLSDTEAEHFCLYLARFLHSLSDRSFCCLGTHILTAVQGEASKECIFCDILCKESGVRVGAAVQACPF